MRFFNFLKMLSTFSRKFRETFRKFWKYGLAKILKSSRKINGKLQNIETFHEMLANFDLKKRTLIKIKAILMEFWKDLINLKESKKPSDKSLRVLVKTRLIFEIPEKTLKFTCKNLNGKLIFYPFFSHFPGLFHLYTFVTYHHFWDKDSFSNYFLFLYFSPMLNQFGIENSILLEFSLQKWA